MQEQKHELRLLREQQNQTFSALLPVLGSIQAIPVHIKDSIAAAMANNGDNASLAQLQILTQTVNGMDARMNNLAEKVDRTLALLLDVKRGQVGSVSAMRERNLCRPLAFLPGDLRHDDHEAPLTSSPSPHAVSGMRTPGKRSVRWADAIPEQTAVASSSPKGVKRKCMYAPGEENTAIDASSNARASSLSRSLEGIPAPLSGAPYVHTDGSSGSGNIDDCLNSTETKIPAGRPQAKRPRLEIIDGNQSNSRLGRRASLNLPALSCVSARANQDSTARLASSDLPVFATPSRKRSKQGCGISHADRSILRPNLTFSPRKTRTRKASTPGPSASPASSRTQARIKEEAHTLHVRAGSHAMATRKTTRAATATTATKASTPVIASNSIQTPTRTMESRPTLRATGRRPLEATPDAQTPSSGIGVPAYEASSISSAYTSVCCPSAKPGTNRVMPTQPLSSPASSSVTESDAPLPMASASQPTNGSNTAFFTRPTSFALRPAAFSCASSPGLSVRMPSNSHSTAQSDSKSCNFPTRAFTAGSEQDGSAKSAPESSHERYLVGVRLHCLLSAPRCFRGSPLYCFSLAVLILVGSFTTCDLTYLL